MNRLEKLIQCLRDFSAKECREKMEQEPEDEELTIYDQTPPGLKVHRPPVTSDPYYPGSNFLWHPAYPGYYNQYYQPGSMGVGPALHDVLRHVASADTKLDLTWKVARDILEEEFWRQGYELAEDDGNNAAAAYDDLKIIYRWQRMKDCVFFTPHSLENIDEIMSACISRLTQAGIQAIRKNKGILIQENKRADESHDPIDIANRCKGELCSSESDADGTSHTILINTHAFTYRHDPLLRTLTIHCQRNQIDVHISYNLKNNTPKYIADVVKYQAGLYEKLFDPDTYGLTITSPSFRLKKHWLQPVDGGVLVVTPDSKSYLLSREGEYLLMKRDGTLNLNVGATFKKCRAIGAIKFEHGEVFEKFGHILERRGYFGDSDLE